MSGDLDDIDVTLVVRYLGDDCTPTERAHVEHWMAATPGRAAYVESLREIRDTWAARRPRFDHASGWTAMAHRLSLKDSAAAQRPAAVFHHARPRGVGVRGDARRRLVLLAASVLVMLAVGGIGVLGRGSVTAGWEYGTAAGQRLSVTLADGTQLTLAPASRVRLAAGYGDGGSMGGSKARPYVAREVEFEGEAYFTVVHDAVHPFAVRTRNAVVRDVGTVFDVRAYPEDRALRVAVADGRVAITGRDGLLAARPPQPLAAGDVATVADATITIEHGADLASLTAWRQGRLVFAKTPLAEVVQDLSRAFDLSIRVEDSVLASQRVTASFERESVEQVLDDIASIVGGSYERVGRAVVIKRHGAGAQWRGGNSVTPLTIAQQAEPTIAQPTAQTRVPRQ